MDISTGQADESTSSSEVCLLENGFSLHQVDRTATGLIHKKKKVFKCLYMIKEWPYKMYKNQVKTNKQTIKHSQIANKQYPQIHETESGRIQRENK